MIQSDYSEKCFKTNKIFDGDVTTCQLPPPPLSPLVTNLSDPLPSDAIFERPPTQMLNLPSVWLLHGGLGHILKSSQIWTPYAFFEQHFIPLETENGWLNGQSTDLSANRNINIVNF